MPDREPREPRDVLGEALWLDQGSPLGGSWQGLHPNLKADISEMADGIIARLAEAGYRIVKEGD